MSEILKICAVALIGIILIALIRTYKPEFTVEITICVSVIILWAVADSLKYAFTYMENLYCQLSYGKEYFSVIIKALAIAYLTEFTAALCEDAGQKSISTKVELAGKIAIFFVAIPVFTSLLNLLTGLI
ncbi:MAG: hypothetical protein IJB73_04580 [Firmicutes bacterium]|nr:hypothetical protein [Bacillota bacterium]